MHYTSTLIGNLFIVRWLDAPEIEDNVAMCRDVRMARQRAGVPLVFCNIIKDPSRIPSSEVRHHTLEMTPLILELCDSMHLVLEGEGVVLALLRTVIRGMMLASRSAGRIALHSSFKEFLRKNVEKISLDASTVTERAREFGIVS